LFTRHFEKPLLALSAISVTGLLFACVAAALMATSTWAERELEAFPFKSEDWLRVLLPSPFEGPHRDQIMLAGASTVRENFRYDLFEAEYPNHDVYQAGMSAGTITDVTVALEYVERVHGVEALPEFISLGISLRIIANLPDERPFAESLNRYSPHFFAREEGALITLEPKGPLESIAARARFLAAKQPDRFRIGLLAVLAHWLSGDEYQGDEEPALAQSIDRAFRSSLPSRIFNTHYWYGQVLKFTFLDVLRFIISPYKYSFKKPVTDENYSFLKDENYDPEKDHWSPIYLWNPNDVEADTRTRLKHFVDFVTRHEIPTIVFNLPERDLSRARYEEANYRAYLELVREELVGIEFVDLRYFLDTADFFDREHTTTAGSIRLTNEVIRQMNASAFSSRLKPGLEPVDSP
jgi:hypothetical protein